LTSKRIAVYVVNKSVIIRTRLHYIPVEILPADAQLSQSRCRQWFDSLLCDEYGTDIEGWQSYLLHNRNTKLLR